MGRLKWPPEVALYADVNDILIALDEHAEELLELHAPEAARARQVEKQRKANPSAVAQKFRAFAKEHNAAFRAKQKQTRSQSTRVSIQPP